MAFASSGRWYDGTSYYGKDNIYKGKDSSWRKYAYNERVTFSNIGCAGRCAILCLDGEKDTVLNTTLGATSYNITNLRYNQLSEDSELCDYSIDTGVRIERNSALGTYLCNLRKITTPYGGNSLHQNNMN